MADGMGSGIDLDKVAKIIGMLQLDNYLLRESLAAAQSELRGAQAKLAALAKPKETDEPPTKEATCPTDKANP